MYIILSIILLLALLCLLLFHWRKKEIICRIQCMESWEKCELLNGLANPIGYYYSNRQDIFTSRVDAWQKQYGYGAVYDRAAPYFNMVFDSCPIYFDYEGRTWLIEFWKGQYGISTGSEVGVYCADRILAPSEYKNTIFHAVQEDEMLDITTHLWKDDRCIATLRKKHWWLTIFSIGQFGNPSRLTLDVSIEFPSPGMRDAFLKALFENGFDEEHVYATHTMAALRFSGRRRNMSFLKRIYCHYVQLKNRLFCKLYRFVTRPFSSSCDKLLYLYYYLPFIFRRMLRLRRYKKAPRKNMRR